MNDARSLDRQTADTYAAWFRALADGTRVQIVSLLANADRGRGHLRDRAPDRAASGPEVPPEAGSN